MSGPNVQASNGDLDFDPAALEARYRAEREKRLRADGNAQYIEVDGRFDHLLVDPFADPDFARAPLDDEVEVVVIGGGFSGLMAATRLREAGIETIRIIEEGADFGGTWYWNRYPGVACDIEAYTYLPLLEETGFMPGHRFAKGHEIREHCARIARTFDLYRDACFQTRVSELRWDEATGLWTVRTDRDDRMRARFVVVANFASITQPKLPGVPGLDRFKGHVFHTCRWDYAYTHGDSTGGLTGLADKRVGIIGTGATAVQCIPHLAAGAKHLTVFQRTPSSIDIRDDRPTDPEWVQSLKPGWQHKRMMNSTTITSGRYAEEDLVKDSWTESMASVNQQIRRREAAGEIIENRAELAQLADYAKMEKIRRRADAEVDNKAWAEQLKPYYNQFCKRPCIQDDYLTTYNRPNVTLVDTDGKGVEAVTERGVLANGVEHELDCLVFASGFEVYRSFERRIGYPIVGRDGAVLHDRWATGASTLHGLFSRGFPNLLVMSLVQSAHTFNNTHQRDEQAKHIAYVVSETKARGIDIVEASEEAERAWVAAIDKAAPQDLSFFTECTPSYRNLEGDLSAYNARDLPWASGPIPFFEALERWREAGDLPGLETRSAAGR